MATTPSKPKGILKKVVSAEQEAADAALSKPKVDARGLAVQHAQIIQHRKDLEGQILDSIITLSEHPQVRIGGYSASNPAPPDVEDFKSHVRLFQPSDYDALIEERNVNSLCGYALCPQPNARQGRGGQWKLVSSGIVHRKELEKWCSNSCAKRALYVKVQLNETAAWERAGIPDIVIDLLDEEKPAEDPTTQVARDLNRLKVDDEKRARADSATLALERGDVRKKRPRGLMAPTIRENEVKPPRQGVSFTDETPEEEDMAEDHLKLEGHKPKSWTGKPQSTAVDDVPERP
jgi:RNA polymerase II-associated protein 2